MFATNYSQIIQQIEAIDPIEYGKSRNYIDGAVTKLSPYISRGVISTRQVAIRTLARGFEASEIESFLKELAWRDYFQQVWIALGDKIDQDIKQAQTQVSNHQIAQNIVEAHTGITAIDQGIRTLYDTGYMHNHLRMYVASMACNIAQSHWLVPAQWLYFYLLDADWASNALSWQWVAGCFSQKKYFANQANINKYCHTHQTHTFLAIEYESFAGLAIPQALQALTAWQADTLLPDYQPISLDSALPTYIYNFYNLDPHWDKHRAANRVLLLEPSFFKKYPISPKNLDFGLELAKNIDNLQILVGEFADLSKNISEKTIHYKEHPTNAHYRGIRHAREWLFPQISGYYPSFFSYWKKCEKYLKNLMSNHN
ncbi:MAG: deoxyribodipyrimidine photolyase [Microscillaceae bacterium]|jgi:deoxyribodipyrimidine photo-lyase|nr:deoxyribodipyrimidine photolyase [Microscillaceae bacterium]